MKRLIYKNFTKEELGNRKEGRRNTHCHLWVWEHIDPSNKTIIVYKSNSMDRREEVDGILASKYNHFHYRKTRRMCWNIRRDSTMANTDDYEGSNMCWDESCRRRRDRECSHFWTRNRYYTPKRSRTRAWTSTRNRTVQLEYSHVMTLGSP